MLGRMLTSVFLHKRSATLMEPVSQDIKCASQSEKSIPSLSGTARATAMINPTGCGGLPSDTAADGQWTESRLWKHSEQEALHFLHLSTEKMASGWFEQQPRLFRPDVTGHPGCCVMTTGERICVFDIGVCSCWPTL